jgi:hypothetical protein
MQGLQDMEPRVLSQLIIGSHVQFTIKKKIPPNVLNLRIRYEELLKKKEVEDGLE